jgi:hypothetical protein
MNGARPSIMEEIALIMNNFRYTRCSGWPLHPAELVETHAASQRWLQRELSEPFAGKAVVITHHARLMQGWYSGRGEDAARFAYCDALDQLMGQHSTDPWVYGHIHECFDYEAHGVRVVCNPRGYYNYREAPSFEADKLISF